MDNFSGDEILNHARQHGVLQLFNEQVHAGTVTGIGDELSNKLRSAAHSLVAQDMLLNAATRELLDLLFANEIPALLLKGTPIAQLYYPATYLRSRCDTDIYIAEDDCDRTTKVLAANGYKLSGLGTRKYSSTQFGAAKPSLQQMSMHFDIHLRLTNRIMFQTTLPFEECLADSQPVAPLGAHAKTLSKTGLMMHACIHRIGHGRNTERNRLLWLYDIHLLAAAMDDTELEKFARAARNKAIAALCADALGVSEEIFGTPLPETYVRDLAEAGKGERSAKLIKSSKLRWAWEDMRSLGSLKAQIAFARELLKL